MDLIGLFFVGGMTFICLALPTLLVVMAYLDRTPPRTSASASRHSYERSGPLTTVATRL